MVDSVDLGEHHSGTSSEILGENGSGWETYADVSQLRKQCRFAASAYSCRADSFCPLCPTAQWASSQVCPRGLKSPADCLEKFDQFLVDGTARRVREPHLGLDALLDLVGGHRSQCHLHGAGAGTES